MMKERLKWNLYYRKYYGNKTVGIPSCFAKILGKIHIFLVAVGDDLDGMTIAKAK